MSAPTECLRCKGPMSQGLVVDRANYNMGVAQQWVEGMPERSLWLGLKTKGRESYSVHTYRCDNCGYLESYGNAPVDI